MPAAPKNVTGSSFVRRPWWDIVSIRTVVPDLMRSTGATRAERYPQMTVSGREPNVTSGLTAVDADCAAADDTRAAMPIAVQQVIITPRTCLDIGSILSGKICAQHSIEYHSRVYIRITIVEHRAVSLLGGSDDAAEDFQIVLDDLTKLLGRISDRRRIEVLDPPV